MTNPARNDMKTLYTNNMAGAAAAVKDFATRKTLNILLYRLAKLSPGQVPLFIESLGGEVFYGV